MLFTVSSFEGLPYQYPLRVVKSEDNDMKAPPAVNSAVQGQAGTTHGGTRGKHGHNGKDEGRPSKRRG